MDRLARSTALLALFAVLGSGCTRNPAGPSPGGSRHVDRSKAFSYALPDGWTAQSVPQFAHDLVLLPKTDARNRSIVITDQPPGLSLADLKVKYEADLAKAFKGFQLIRSGIVSLGGRDVAKIVHHNTAPGVPVRQLNYIVELGPGRYFFACTVMQDDGERFDAPFDELIASLRVE
jgi:hypothetical protein